MTETAATVETLRKSQLFSIAWTEPANLSSYTFDTKKQLADVQLTPKCSCTIKYYMESTNPSLGSASSSLFATLNSVSHLHHRFPAADNIDGARSSAYNINSPSRLFLQRKPHRLPMTSAGAAGQKKETTNVLKLEVTLHGVNSLLNVSSTASSIITIKAKKDGLAGNPSVMDDELTAGQLIQFGEVHKGQSEYRWQANWDTCCRSANLFLYCNSCGKRPNNGSYFEVLIDFGNHASNDSNFMRPGQKNVLQHMEKLLADRHLADVTFKFSGKNCRNRNACAY